MMTSQAKYIIDEYEYKSVLDEEEESMLVEAFEQMIEETGDTQYMVRLGGFHYEKKRFNLALKYYEMADSCGDAWAPEGLGYIWYYGRTGEKDYEKAFRYFSKAAANGFLRSKMKLADMYRNGYYVEKDRDKYCSIIEQLYEELQWVTWSEELNDIYIRLARIREEQGRTDEAVRLYKTAREHLAMKIEYNPFFGDLNVMKGLLDDLYRITEPDMNALDIFDLYHFMKSPCKVTFLYDDGIFEVEGVDEDGIVGILFRGEHFGSIDEFFEKAEIGGERVPMLCSLIYGVRVV